MENNQLQKKLNLHSIITQKDNQIELMQIEKPAVMTGKSLL